jgi:hypothetical protein
LGDALWAVSWEFDVVGKLYFYGLVVRVLSLGGLEGFVFTLLEVLHEIMAVAVTWGMTRISLI